MYTFVVIKVISRTSRLSLVKSTVFLQQLSPFLIVALIDLISVLVGLSRVYLAVAVRSKPFSRY